MHRPSARRLVRLAVVAALAATVSGGPLGAPVTTATTTFSTGTKMILHNVPPEDLLANTRGVCDGSFTIVVRNVAGAAGALRYLDAAQACGVKAVLFFSSTVSGGTVYPWRVGPLVRAVKSHPALYGYLSVKEPSWVGISGYEIRSLYKAFKAADPGHPVVALFGDIPHFGDARNPYTSGMADIVMVDWYPVETASGGCSWTGTTYISSGPRWYSTKVYPKVHALTPRAPIWVMVQTHKYLAPVCHKKQRPSQFALNRQVREALTYAHASGIAFHTFSNVNYNIDERRDPQMVSWMKLISSGLRAGTWQ
jgi:hypothetical protein